MIDEEEVKKEVQEKAKNVDTKYCNWCERAAKFEAEFCLSCLGTKFKVIIYLDEKETKELQ